MNTKPRDEIAQINVEDREASLNLEEWPLIPIGDLGVGDVVLHDGFWTKIDGWEMRDPDTYPHIHLILHLEFMDETDPKWERRIMVIPEEKFYVKPAEQRNLKARAATPDGGVVKGIHPSLVRRVPEGDQLH